MRHLDRNRFMKWYGVVMKVLCSIFISGLAYAGDVASSAPNTFPDLRTLFVEAEGEVLVKTIQNMPRAQLGAGPYWIDNHRVLLTVRELKDWKARKDERSKIVIFDVDTGAVEETPYRGDLTCYGREGQILVQDYPFFLPNTFQPGDTREDSWFYLTGKLGEPLTRFKRAKGDGLLNPYTCQFYDNARHDFGDKHMVNKLRPSDGALDVPKFESPDKNIRMVSPEGKVQWSIEFDKLCNSFGRPRYLPWLHRYFASTSWGNVAPGCMELNKNSWHFSPQGVELKPLPRLIQEMRRPGRHVGGNGETYWARPGMYVFVQFSTGYDGLYWQDEKSGQLKRVLRKPWGLDDLSPDGCRNLVMIKPAVIVELCKGEKQ